MNLGSYKTSLGKLTHGKRLPSALYVHVGSNGDDAAGLPLELADLLSRVREQLELGVEFNVVKFNTEALKLSFLAYPNFFENPHPQLAEAVAIDLATGKARRTSYRERPNPPILHRKETFLPSEHSAIPEFEALTKAEEAAGLFENSSTIGFKLNWERLLSEKGLGYEGHKLIKQNGASEAETGDQESPTIDRHKTAISRYDLSKPVKTLLEYGLLEPESSMLDYGCGLGADVDGLTALEHDVTGWDPVHRPEGEKRKAAVVNLGYVINVIEDPAERVETLIDAWNHAQQLLVVSAMIQGQETYAYAKEFGDGVLTQRNTFQKYFEQTELQAYIEDALDHEAVPVALGIFYVFRDTARTQDFLSGRNKRAIDWEQISQSIGFERPQRERRPRLSTYEKHKELIDAFWTRMLELGRVPKKEEFGRFEEVRSACRSANQAALLFVEKFGQGTLDEARRRRKEDLLVYLADGEFQKRRTPFNHLSKRLRTDIRTFFGSYSAACDESRRILFDAGDPDELEDAIEGLEFGWLDAKEGHFTIHRTLLNELPVILRLYVACGTRMFGDPNETDLIKIHLRSGKLTLQIYDDFDGQQLPVLKTRIKIDLRRYFVNVFDHTEGPEHQMLFFKERFLPPEYPGRDKMEAYSKRLRKLGLNESNIGYGPSKEAFQAALNRLNLTWGLNRRKQKA